MSTTITAPEESYPSLSTVFFTWISVSIIGAMIIWAVGTGTVTTTRTFWVPDKVRFLNEVDGRPVTISTYTTARPAVNVGLDDFKRMSAGRLVEVAVTLVPQSHVIGVQLHYSTMVEGNQYYATTGIYARGDTYSWMKDGTMIFSGYLYGGAVFLSIVWWILVGYFCFEKNAWFTRTYRHIIRRYRQ